MKKILCFLLFFVGPSLNNVCAQEGLKQNKADPLSGYSVEAVNVDIYIDTTTQLLQGKTEITVRVPGNNETVVFFLNKNFTTKTIMDEHKTNLSLPDAPGGIVIPAVTHGTHTYFIVYEGSVTMKGQVLSLPDEIFWHPTVPLKSFSYKAKINVPATMTTVSCGELKKTETAADRSITYWEAEHIRNGGIIVAAPFQVFHKKQGRIQYNAYLLDNAAKSEELLENIAKAVQFFDKQYCPYPYSVFSLVEDPTMQKKNGRGTNSMIRVESSAMTGTSYFSGFFQHEIAHLWWGTLINGAFSKTDSLSIIMLTESMAHFSALDYLYTNDQTGFKHFNNWLMKDYADFSNGNEFVLKTISIKDEKMPVIAKCGFFLWELSRFIGENNFRAGTAEFLKTYAWQQTDYKSFLSILRKRAKNGEDYDKFVEKWFSSKTLYPN